jgi:AICAR transformylase/IMP cyclohydrolase PurH
MRSRLDAFLAELRWTRKPAVVDGQTIGLDAGQQSRIGCTRIAIVIQPGGSLRDEDVISACNEYGMSMVFSGVRLFHH